MLQHDPNQIKKAIRERYAEVSNSVEGKFKYPTGRAGAEALDYDPSLVRSAPEGLLQSFCGVGNPFSLGVVQLGETILDVGCGGGFDLFCAGRMVGPEGKVHGIDMTPEMVERARKNMAEAGVSNTEVRQGNAEQLPFDGETFDRILSNGVLNLSPEKEKAFSELHRVLKPGGRLQFADIVLKGEFSPGEQSAKAWSN